MLQRMLFAVSLGLVVSTPAMAQRFMITPTAGYRVGGNFPDGFYTGQPNQMVTDLKLTNGFAFGGILDIALSNYVTFEALVDHQGSTLRLGSTSNDSIPEIPVGVNYIQGGFLFQKPGKTAPFFAFTLGATYFDPGTGFESETRFSGGFSLGARTFFNERFGARFEGRMLSTNMGRTDTGFCDAGGCWVWPNTTLITQIGLNAGLIVGF